MDIVAWFINGAYCEHGMFQRNSGIIYQLKKFMLIMKYFQEALCETIVQSHRNFIDRDIL